MGNHLLTVPVGGQFNNPAIRTHVVVFHRHADVSRFQISLSLFLGNGVKMATPGKTDIHVFGIAVSFQFPHPGNVHRSPAGIIIIVLEKVGRTLVSMLHPFEFPLPVERQFHFISFITGMVFQAVHLIHISILPFRECLSKASCGHQQTARHDK